MSGVIGVLGAPAVVFADERGAVSVPRLRAELDWVVGTGDRWRRPAVDVGVRQHRVGAAPAVETRLSVPGGDVVQHVFGAGGSPAVAVVDFTNESPAPVALALVVRAEPGTRLRELRADDRVVFVRDEALLRVDRPPRQHATASDEADLLTLLEAGATDAGGVVAARDRSRGVALALVWPLPHRTTLRVAVPLVVGPRGVDADLRGAPDVATATRAWSAPLHSRGMRFEHDDAALADAVDAARAALLVLAGADRPRPAVDVAVACEDWGFDQEALTVWPRLSLRERRRAARRDADAADAWVRFRAHLERADGTLSPQPARLLRALREVLLRDGHDGVELLGGFPAEWRGRSLAVHDAPTRHGPVSFALRWHGPRPALLWDAPDGVTLRAPALDPTFAAVGGAGETLLTQPA